jgi:hypothetical protein
MSCTNPLKMYWAHPKYTCTHLQSLLSHSSLFAHCKVLPFASSPPPSRHPRSRWLGHNSLAAECQRLLAKRELLLRCCDLHSGFDLSSRMRATATSPLNLLCGSPLL